MLANNQITTVTKDTSREWVHAPVLINLILQTLQQT